MKQAKLTSCRWMMLMMIDLRFVQVAWQRIGEAWRACVCEESADSTLLSRSWVPKIRQSYFCYLSYASHLSHRRTTTLAPGGRGVPARFELAPSGGLPRVFCPTP